MDLKLKGKLWPGNIFHQFESICHDVDDFMSKDTVKFVENQVQSVGVSVQRLYSNVVQDILPLSGNIVKCKVQMTNDRKADSQDCVNSATNTRPKPTCVDEEHISENQSSTDARKNSDTSLSMELDHVRQISRNLSSDPSQENGSYFRLNEDDDGMVSNGTCHSSEENSIKDLVALTACSNSSKCISSEISGEDNKSFTLIVDAAPSFSSWQVGTADGHKNSEQNIDNSVALSPHEEAHLSIKTDTDSYNSFLEEMECPSDISINGCTCTIKSNLPTDEHPYSENRNVLAASVTSDEKVNQCGCTKMHSSLVSSDAVADSLANSDTTRNLAAESMTSGYKDECECGIVDSPLPSSSNMDDRASLNSNDNRSLSASLVMSTNIVDENESMGMDSPLPSTSNAADSALGTYEIPRYSFSTKDKSSDVSRSLQSSEHPGLYFPDEKQKKSVMPSSCFTFPKSSDTIKSRPANSMNKPEIICHHQAKFVEYPYYEDPILPESVEPKSVDKLCALSITEPNSSSAQTHALTEGTSLQTDKSRFVAGSSENRFQRHPKNYELNLSASSEIGDANDYSCGAHDLNKETIDLSQPDVKEDQENVILNGILVHSSSLRRRNFRYYKKLIQDAFTSQKRLAKEYEHLAILYGDINFDSSEHFRSSSTPASPARYAQTTGSQLSHETIETEWELL